MGPRYHLVARLERGAFSEWFRGVAEGDEGPQVLIEIFSPKASDRAHAQALLRCAARTRALGSPRALGYDEVGFVHERLVAVRPLFEGYDLDDALRRLQAKEVVLTPALAIWIVAEVAQVVALAHGAGLVHGALAPSSIFLSNDGAVRVAQFGGLQALAASPALAALAAREPHAYRAPEVRSVLAVTPASDVYALGAIAYELLTLKSVAAARGGALPTQHDALVAPSRLDRRIHARIDAPIMRALERNPARRPAAASEFGDELRSVLGALRIVPGPGELERFVRELFPGEVSVGAGSPSSLPFRESFELEGVGGTAADPPTPPPAPALVAGHEDLSKTRPDLPCLERAEARVLAPPGTNALEWDAPPGAMEVSHRSRRGAQHRDAPLGVDSARSALTARSGASTRPLPAPPPAGEGAAAPRGGSFRKTEVDWHPPPDEARDPSLPRAGRRIRGLGRLLLASLVGLFALSLGRWLHGMREGAPGAASAAVSSRPSQVTAAPHEPDQPPPGSLSLTTDAPASVFVDGADTGRTTPLTRYPLAQGEHHVLLLDATTGSTRQLRVRIASGVEEKRVEKVRAAAKRRKP